MKPNQIQELFSEIERVVKDSGYWVDREELRELLEREFPDRIPVESILEATLQAFSTSTQNDLVVQR